MLEPTNIAELRLTFDGSEREGYWRFPATHPVDRIVDAIVRWFAAASPTQRAEFEETMTERERQGLGVFSRRAASIARAEDDPDMLERATIAALLGSRSAEVDLRSILKDLAPVVHAQETMGLDPAGTWAYARSLVNDPEPQVARFGDRAPADRSLDAMLIAEHPPDHNGLRYTDRDWVEVAREQRLEQDQPLIAALQQLETHLRDRQHSERAAIIAHTREALLAKLPAFRRRDAVNALLALDPLPASDDDDLDDLQHRVRRLAAQDQR